jgi:HEAT repeat protein
VTKTRLNLLLYILSLAAVVMPVLGYYYTTEYDVLSETELQSLGMEFAHWPQDDQFMAAQAILEIFDPKGDPRAADYLIYHLIRVFNVGKTDRAKVAASKVLGKIGEPAVIPLISSLTGGPYYYNGYDHTAEVRAYAAETLGIIGDERAFYLLIDVVENCSVDRGKERQGAVIALGEYGDPRAVEPLINALGDEREDDMFLSSTARSLGKIGDPRAVDALIPLLNNGWYNYRITPSIKADIIWALGEIGDPRAVDILISSLDDSSATVRAAAASALGEIGDPRAIDPLRNVVTEDSREVVREAAADALTKLRATEEMG